MTITIQTSPNFTSKAIAFIIVAVGMAELMQLFDNQTLADISSMSPAAFIQSQRDLSQQGFILHLVEMLVMGALYLGSLEAVAWGIRKIMPKKFAASPSAQKIST
jgi:hypothetical protein